MKQAKLYHIETTYKNYEEFARHCDQQEAINLAKKLEEERKRRDELNRLAHEEKKKKFLREGKNTLAPKNEPGHQYSFFDSNIKKSANVKPDPFIVKITRTVVEEEYKLFFPLDRTVLKEKLFKGHITVNFRKLDGSLRNMKCTLHHEYLTKLFGPTSTSYNQSFLNEKNPNIVTVVDTEVNEWRCFDYTRVFSITDENDESYFNLDYR